MTTSEKDAEVDALIESLHARLVSSGDWARMSKKLFNSLQSSEWDTSLKQYANEQASNAEGTIHLDELMQLVLAHARATVPASDKADIEASIRTFVENNVEE